MAVYRTQKYRLYPSQEQADVLAEFARVVRFVYNLALEQRRDFHRQFRRATGTTLNYISQGRQLTQLRQEFEWVRAVPVDFEHGALRDLDKAFANYFRGGGFPKFRKAGKHETFEIKGRSTVIERLNKKWSRFYIPKLGWVKFRDTRPVHGALRSIRVIQQSGVWFACVVVSCEPATSENNLPAVGIDRGIALALACSNGSTFEATDEKRITAQLRTARRLLSRKKRGSKRYAKQRKIVAGLYSRVARMRRDWQHKATTNVARNFGVVVIEDLKTSAMTARAHNRGVASKGGLNRAILSMGWYGIELMLAYKLEERGGTLIKVNPAYTSQTCSACGTIDKHSRESQAIYACRHCGHTENADINAAKNILRQGLPGVDGGGCAPDEARTIHLRLVA